MNLSDKKKLVLLGFFLALFVAIPLTISLLKQQQETRSHATGSTKLSFAPESSVTAPIKKKNGDQISLDLMIDPGQNLVTFVRFQIKYDPTKLKLSTTDPFTLNQAAFPAKVEGPIAQNDLLSESVSVGADPTKAIQKITKVGTVNFTAIGPTTGGTTVTFTTVTQVLSSGSNDQASENVLSTTTPAVLVVDEGGITVTPGASGTPGAGTPTATPSGAITVTPINLSPTPTPDTTLLDMTLLLHGVGAAGDNPNPKTSELSNKNPLHPERDLTVWLYDSNNELVASTSAPILYDADGTFKGEMDLGPTFKEGNYNLKVKTDRYLRKLMPGIVHIKPLSANTVPEADLVAGDVNGDNVLNVLDYNALLDCGYGLLDPLPMADQASAFNTKACQAHVPAEHVDIDDNGIISNTDYNLFLRELSVQNGD